MRRKPATVDGYPPEQAVLVRKTCLHIATKLGDLMDEIVIVGGLVPSLIIDQGALPEGAVTHAGTMDLDIGKTTFWSKPSSAPCVRPISW